VVRIVGMVGLTLDETPVWISISDPVEFFQNPVQPGSGSEVQNPVESRIRNRIMFNTGIKREKNLAGDFYA